MAVSSASQLEALRHRALAELERGPAESRLAASEHARRAERTIADADEPGED